MSECDCWVISELRDHGISLFDEMKYLLYIAASKQPPKQTDSDSSHHHPTPPGSVKPTAKFEGPPLRLSPVFCLTAVMSGSVDVLARECFWSEFLRSHHLQNRIGRGREGRW